MKNFSCLPGAAGFNFTNFFDSARLDGQRAIRCQDAPNNQNLLNQSTEENVFYSATVSSRKNYRGKKKFLCQTAKNFQFTKTVSGRKKFEKLNIGWETKKIGAISFNGPVLGLVRVSAAFHCPPLNNFTKIKLSQQTTKPPH